MKNPPVSETALEPVPRAVVEFIEKPGFDIAHCKTSDISDLTDFSSHIRCYLVELPVEKLWDLYSTVDPRRLWQGKIIDFGVVFDPLEHRLFNREDRGVPPFHMDQVYVLDLNFLGVYEIPAAFKISRMDEAEHALEFIYLEENKSNGVQQIGFHPVVTRDGREASLIEHVSFFRSGNNFRDRILYPPFHEDTIDEFHENIFRQYQISFRKGPRPRHYSLR